MHQEIDAPYICDIVSSNIGSCICDIRQGMAGPIESEANRTARVHQWKMRELAAFRQCTRLRKRSEAKWRCDRKDRLSKQMLADRGQLLGVPMHRRTGQHARRYEIHQIG